MKKFILILKLSLIAGILISCGTSDTQEGSNQEILNKNRINIINCDGTGDGLNDCINFTCIQNNDRLVSNENNTVLKIIHLINGNKKVCVVSADIINSAYLLR